MLLKRAVIVVGLVIAVSLQTHDAFKCKVQSNVEFKITEGAAGTHRCAMHALDTDDKEVLASLCMVKGSTLALFVSPAFEALDQEQLPSEIVTMIALAKKAQIAHDLHNVIVLGDLHVPVEHRGHGFAQKLLAQTCTQAFDEGATLVMLIPEPFEYEQGVIKSLQKNADYENKKERLIALYQKCGFEKGYAGTMVYMYRTPDQDRA